MLLDFLNFISVTPYSTLFITFLAFIHSLTTILLNRKFIDRRLFSEWQKEIAEWSSERELAKKTGDKKLMAKVKKQELRIMQIRSKMSKQQTKSSLIMMISFMIIWWLLIFFYGNTPVAYIPLFWSRVGIPFVFWYPVCHFFFNFVLSKIFNVEMGMLPKT
ncbi:MAG: EMC3/TMCO1 family protein [Candidatus Bathyarchaeia archaeon]